MKNEGGLDAGQLRFVLLRHEMPPDSAEPSHWDLMFEQEKSEMLLTLQLFELPQNTLSDQPQILPAKRIADHRPLYLDYEGKVSQNRGRVRRVAQGVYRRTNASPRTARYEIESNQIRASILLSSCEPGEELTLCVERWKDWLVR